MNLWCFLRRAAIVILILVLIGWLFPRSTFAVEFIACKTIDDATTTHDLLTTALFGERHV